MNIWKFCMDPVYRLEVRKRKIKKIQKDMSTCECQIISLVNKNDLTMKRLKLGEIEKADANEKINRNLFLVGAHKHRFIRLEAELERRQQKV